MNTPTAVAPKPEPKVLVAKTQVVIEPLTEKRVVAAIRIAKASGMTIEGTTFERCFKLGHGIDLLLNAICTRVEKNAKARDKRKAESALAEALANAKTIEDKIALLKKLEGMRVELAALESSEGEKDDFAPAESSEKVA